MSKIIFNKYDKFNLDCNLICSILLQSHRDNIFDVKFIKKKYKLIKTLADSILLPIDIINIMFDYTHDIITIKCIANKDRLIINLEGQFELVFNFNRTCLLNISHISDNILKYSVVNDLTRDNIRMEDTNRHILDFDAFVNSYMQYYYNIDKYIRNDSSDVICVYDSNNIFKQYVIPENEQERMIMESTESVCGYIHMIAFKPINHKLIKQMIVIIKKIYSVINKLYNKK